MKELVEFSLKRRFFNSATILLNLLLFIAFGLLFHADKLLDMINPDMFASQIVYLNNIDEKISDALMQIEQEGFEFIVTDKQNALLIEENPKSFVLEHHENYELISQYPINSTYAEAIDTLLTQVHQMLLLNELQNDNHPIEGLMSVIVTDKKPLINDVDLSADKQNLLFMVITSIYFTMLSFSTSVANEVIYEKSTRQLELILTSVSAKIHFLSKMIVGWLSILIQFTAVLLSGLFWFIVRNSSDMGLGLLELLRKLNLFQIEAKTFNQLLSSIKIEHVLISKAVFILLFLMVGILFIQMILVIVSSFIANIEEAGNVQAPFYLILLAVYYFTLSVNTPYQMSEGIGFYLSFLPFFSMLFMPCRILIQSVSMYELCLSLGISLLAMNFVLQKGSEIYQRGVLDYASKGLLGVLNRIFVHNRERRLL